MRITIAQGAFLPVPALRGGAVEKIWFALGQEFARRGHAVKHISRSFGDLPKREILEGVRHLRVPGYDAPASLAWLKALDLAWALKVRAKLPPADVLVTHTFWLPMLVRSPRVGKLYVHVARYPRGQMRFYRHAARLQTVSAPIGQAIAQELPRGCDLVRCIPNPLPEATFGSLPPPPLAGELRLLYVGRIHPEKGIELLLRALLELDGAWRLKIVGPAQVSAGGGGEKFLGELRALARPIEDRIEWVGPVYDSATLAEHYRAATLFVYPSLAQRGETFGLAPLEAMSHGCPPVVSDLACFREFLVADVNGFVFDRAGGVAALRHQLRQLLAHPERIAAARAPAFAKAAEFSVSAIADRYLDDFASLLINGSAPG